MHKTRFSLLGHILQADLHMPWLLSANLHMSLETGVSGRG